MHEYERAVIFRLGILLGPKGPGLFTVFPCIDEVILVDMRTVSFEIPPQEILTKDSVTVNVDAVVYYSVWHPVLSVTTVENASGSTKLLAQTTLRSQLGLKTLCGILQDKDEIAKHMMVILDHATDPWGIKVERVEIKDVRLPIKLQRSMAAEAEASREAKAKIISAKGEKEASICLKEAADIICQSPRALQLRYLQTLNNIAGEKNSTIIFPVPIDMFSGMGSPGPKLDMVGSGQKKVDPLNVRSEQTSGSRTLPHSSSIVSSRKTNFM